MMVWMYLLGVIILISITIGMLLVTNLAYKKGFNNGARKVAETNLIMLETRYDEKKS